MIEQKQTKSSNAWIAVDHAFVTDVALKPYTLQLQGTRALYQSIADDNWILILNTSGQITRVGRVLRIRSDLANTTIYFDRLSVAEAPVSISATSLAIPSSAVSRLDWNDFLVALPVAFGKTIGEIPSITNQIYIRELLQLAVMDDLLGPAGGGHEYIVDMGVRDRYLVGKLAPRETNKNDDNPWEGDSVDIDSGVHEELRPGIHEPGAEFGRATGRVEPESDSSDEIDATSNQSLVPSSLGMTFCISGDVEAIEIQAGWGRYEPLPADEHEFTKKDGKKVKVWQRIPCGGKIILPIVEGQISHQAPDHDQLSVRIQGTIRAKNSNGDRLITLFLVNAQETTQSDTNKDKAWLFQPEIIVRAPQDAAQKAIFRRKPVLDKTGMDKERDALEMIYRNRVEFAVGHGVSIHAQVSDDVNLATEVRTVVMPQYEVQATETPGANPTDRPAMQELMATGLLDMSLLAQMSLPELVAALSRLTTDYAAWISEQSVRIGTDVIGHNDSAQRAVAQCNEILKRLIEGIQTLNTNENALAAFRFANQSMAVQRVRSAFSLSMRRGEAKTLADFDKPNNRSWRPFQLAFLLLSIPSLTDPRHSDRTKPAEAFADLLWFPTGGGKTEAYLGVAAFTMAIRRMQGKIGDFDGSRGLAVVMRYTLRLLTLQQFQRATALICAMEVIRREALAKGDETLGHEPFTIGLWVGNKVTPGTTDESASAIEAIRNPDRNKASHVSPAQLTSCPWCGSEVAPGRDIEVDKKLGRTLIYCGDKKGQCEFSKGKSSKYPHPGLPVLTVDEEIYHRPPTMMIATVDKFAMMAWRGQVRTLFGRVRQECPRHGLLWADSGCTGNHTFDKGFAATKVKSISRIRPPDLIIQDEFHLISGPLGTMVGLYETVVDELCSWKLGENIIKPKIIASTATVRKAREQVSNVFMRQVAVFPPSGLDVEDNFFSVQRPVEEKYGRRYLGVCSPGSSRPAMLIRVYTAFLTASQALFDRFGEPADPYMTMVGYFNSLRELGGMKRLAEDDVQTRSYRVQMSMVDRPALAQRSVRNICELTSRVSSQDIPKYLDQLEVKFKAEFDATESKWKTNWQEGDTRAIDVVLATNMLSVGVDVNRLGLMAVNGQPKGTAEYIQATSRVGRSFPGLVCTVLTWARPRDLSHYESFEQYHATFYKHVEAQSVTPFSPRAMDRGLTGTMLSLMRLENDDFSPNDGAENLKKSNQSEMSSAIEIISKRAGNVAEDNQRKDMAEAMLKQRADEWAKEVAKGGRLLAYEKRGPKKDTTTALIKSPGIQAWDNWTVPMSMREVEPGVKLIMNTAHIIGEKEWTARIVNKDEE